MNVDSSPPPQRRPHVLGLRGYQREGVDFLARRRRCILGDEMGLGKTLQTLCALHQAVAPSDKVLVVSNGAAQYVWRKEVLKWQFPFDVVIVKGNAKTRANIWNAAREERPHKCKLYLCSYAVLRRDHSKLPTNWRAIIADEAHALHNRKTQNFKVVRRLARQTNCLFLITGTPMKRDPSTLWTLLHLINPKMFSSYWRFVNTFCIVEDNYWGGKEILGAKNIRQLRKLLSTYMIRRRKSDPHVAPDLPAKQREIISAEMPPWQRRIYNELVDDMIATLELDANDANDVDAHEGVPILVAPTRLAVITRLRQLLVMPKMLNAELPDGSGLDTVVEHLQGIGDFPHAVIFTPFSKALPFIKERLLNEGWKHVVLLQGGMQPDELSAALQEFEENNGIAVCTIKFAQSFDLDSASYAYFLGAEWEPHDNFQAEDRLHRLTTSSPVNIYYIEHIDSIDEFVLDTVLQKQINVNKVLGTKGEVLRFLRRSPKG